MPFPGREAELRSLAEGLLHRIATFILIPIAFLASISVNLQAEDRVPNIILILVDDMGYSDLGCYGGEIQTPHID
ncbi:MAG: hypothetical protein DWQ31_04175, partial [Planctomycetota bacterium]